MTVDPSLVAILACPQCKGELEHIEAPEEAFICWQCRLRYGVQDSIPNFLIDEAETVPEGEAPRAGASDEA